MFIIISNTLPWTNCWFRLRCFVENYLNSEMQAVKWRFMIMVPRSHQWSLSQGVWQDPPGKAPHRLFWFAVSGKNFCDPGLLLWSSHQSPILQSLKHTQVFNIRSCKKSSDWLIYIVWLTDIAVLSWIFKMGNINSTPETQSKIKGQTRSRRNGFSMENQNLGKPFGEPLHLLRENYW